MAAYSSAVPVRRLLKAIFGTSLAMRICAKWPSGVKIRNTLWRLPEGQRLATVGRGDLGDDERPGADQLLFEARGRLRQPAAGRARQ